MRAFVVALVLIAAAGGVALWEFVLRPSRPEPVEKADPKKMSHPFPDKPSIAVMPFMNMTGEQSQDYFCDGLSESLITALSKISQLFVISRDSTFSYKGKAAKTKQVSEELGVQYVLEGSVRRAGEQMRINLEIEKWRIPFWKASGGRGCLNQVRTISTCPRGTS